MRAFVHCGSSGLYYAIKSNQVCHKAFQSAIRHFIADRLSKNREEEEEEENEQHQGYIFCLGYLATID